MQAARTDADLLASFRGSVQETGKPSKRHSEDATVAQAYPKTVFVEADSEWLTEEFIPFSLDEALVGVDDLDEQIERSCVVFIVCILVGLNKGNFTAGVHGN